MKLLTLFIIIISTIIISTQYFVLSDNKFNLKTIYTNLDLFNQLYSENMYMKNYVNYGLLYPPSSYNQSQFL
jgi:hypothetical protein